jgi:hypothetical protein
MVHLGKHEFDLLDAHEAVLGTTRDTRLSLRRILDYDEPHLSHSYTSGIGGMVALSDVVDRMRNRTCDHDKYAILERLNMGTHCQYSWNGTLVCKWNPPSPCIGDRCRRITLLR